MPNVLEIKTIQIAPFKTLMTALKDMILETNITFTQEGIRILNMDKSQTILSYLRLEAEKFDDYYCAFPKIIIGVNMFHLFKLINTIDYDDTLTIYIDENDYKDGIVNYLGLKFENGDIKQCKIQKLKLIEPETEELEIPDVKYSAVINFPSSDFQKIIRDMMCISDKIEIKSVANEIIFQCEGDFATSEVRRRENEGSMEYLTNDNEMLIKQGEFSLKNLSYFIKCTNLCSNIEIFLENNMPLIIKYDVASLGEIKLCLAPKPSY